jgi:hypothetical protein
MFKFTFKTGLRVASLVINRVPEWNLHHSPLHPELKRKIYSVVIKKRTTIAVSPEVKARLQRLGRKGESYDEILRRLLSTKRSWS